MGALENKNLYQEASEIFYESRCWSAIMPITMTNEATRIEKKFIIDKMQFFEQVERTCSWSRSFHMNEHLTDFSPIGLASIQFM